MRNQLSTVVMACLLFTGCDDSALSVAPALPDELNSRIAIINDLEVLSARVVNLDEVITVGDDVAARPFASSTFAAKASAPTVTLTLVSEIEPPVVDGEILQATSVSISVSNSAVVSYNMRGEPRLGAVDWVSSIVGNRPNLTSGITFNDSDVNAVSTDGLYIYTAAATDAPGFPFAAVMERLKIQSNSVTLIDNNRIPLTSFAGTSVLPAGDVVYATSGDEGNLFAYDSADLSLLGEFPLHDARWVASDEANNRIVVAQGTPGILSVFEHGAFPGGAMNLQNSFAFPGAGIAESKSTVEIAGGKAFIAAGTDGVQIICLDTGLIIGSVPGPDPAALSLDPSVVVTNAVSVDKDLMFISNGEAGVYVAQGAEDFRNANCNTQSITVLGHLNFSDLQSANHVAYKAGYLYVAAGLGGVKIVSVSIK